MSADWFATVEVFQMLCVSFCAVAAGVSAIMAVNIYSRT